MQIDDAWVNQFMSSIDGARSTLGESNLTFSSMLSNFANLRFNTSVAKYDISHYGIENDCSNFYYFEQHGGCAGEVVFYPAGYSPFDYASNLRENDPGHWSLLMDQKLSSYGYHLGIGPVIVANSDCKATEIPGPNINITQWLISNGCTPSTETSTWLIIDLL